MYNISKIISLYVLIKAPIFQKQSTQSEFLDVFYCGHVTYQIWVWFETFKGNVNRTNMANFDAYWTSGAKKMEVLRFP